VIDDAVAIEKSGGARRGSAGISAVHDFADPLFIARSITSHMA
jgi:hypothetical protein